jgi:IMP dehydrogenase
MAYHSSRILFEALTFDDVLLLPAYSQTLPRDASTKTRLTRSLELSIPIISAAMDTVTEFDMAIGMAQEGGLGFIHKNMSIEAQAEQVRRVKRSESGMILDPITLPISATVGDAHRSMAENKIGGIPVVDDHGRLIGIATNRDLRFETNRARPLREVMTTKNLVTALKGISLDEAEHILERNKIEKLPIIDEHGKLAGLITFKDITKRRHRPHAAKDNYGRLRVGAAVGVTADILVRVEALRKAGVDVVSIDTAHGHSEGVLNALRETKAAFPDLDIICGNIATGAAAKALVEAGADAIKVGVGPGSICTTRIIAGVGMPQLSAILEAVDATAGSGIPIIADGGIRFSGDIVKALAAGANTVMIGSLIAGTDEAPGQVVINEGRKFKTYRGMGSLEAMEDGSSDRYFQLGETDVKKLVPEGIVGRVPYKGSLNEILFQLVGGLRAGMGYCGAPNLDTLKLASFVKITTAGVRESHPHDVQIMREAPNYSAQ